MTKTWKDAERAIARLFKGRRLAVWGRAGADVEAGRFAIEVKHRSRIPQLLGLGLAQAAKAAKPGQIPLLVLHPVGARYTESFVILKAKDFFALLGDGDAAEHEAGA